MLLTKELLLSTINSVRVVLAMFVLIIAVISMSVAFFLLMIAMNQNINQAIWEYGCLRSMGITKAQGTRIYIYEAFMVVIGASILGITSGFCAALLINCQLYMILEFPIAI